LIGFRLEIFLVVCRVIIVIKPDWFMLIVV
jgi:hypothetical protein